MNHQCPLNEIPTAALLKLLDAATAEQTKAARYDDILEKRWSERTRALKSEIPHRLRIEKEKM